MTQLQELTIWQFDNSYARLPEHFYSRIHPSPVKEPRLVIINRDLARELGVDLDGLSDAELAQLFSGNHLPQGAEPLAQAYSGHQFGHFTRLGDGRAHLLGEHLTPDGRRVDIQLKGSGPTPYGRRGDGRAALGPMLREYIVGEAMHALGIPTSRGLAVVATGEPVFRESVLPGAVFTRVAASHLRVGTFQHLAAEQDTAGLQQLVTYAIARHYPELRESENPSLDLLRAVIAKQIALIVQWMRVGFIHGVMNTDNMTISGETIDYGPCAFMDSYDPQTVFSSIDHAGRYAFANQPGIVKWNLARFAEALLPLMHADQEQAVALAEQQFHRFDEDFQQAWLTMMRGKLGLFGEEPEDAALCGDLLQWMKKHEADYTNTFRALATANPPPGDSFQTAGFQEWWGRWQARLGRGGKPLTNSFSLMNSNNPDLIPRNHRVEAALVAAEEKADFSVLESLLNALATPYETNPAHSDYRQPPSPEERVRQTFCGT